MKLQPNTWTCGPAALHNAFSTVETRPPSIRRIIALSGWSKTTRARAETGMQPEMFARSCRELGYRWVDVSRRDAEMARLEIELTLNGGSPMLVCCDRDSNGPFAHWIAVIGCTSRHVHVADSARPGPVDHRYTWRQFLARACSVTAECNTLFAMYAVVPQGGQ